MRILQSLSCVMLVSLMVSCLAEASTLSEDNWTRDLGREDHIAYIALEELQAGDGLDWAQGLTFDDFKPALSTFYEKFNWAPNDCWAGSVLRNGVKAYCLPYARLGRYYQSAHDPSVKIFNCIGSCAGLYVWHDTQQNRFYLWGICWNAPGVLGPFLGDPRVSLPSAVKPRKGQRPFPGVSIKVVSQRWLYPNAQDARVPRDEHYDCAHGHMSGRALEMISLNTFITRLRLANRGATDIYYQTQPGEGEKPATCILRSDHPNDWEHALKTNYECDIAGDSWRKLARGEEIEWERLDQAFAPGSADFVLLLNDKASYWDAGKLLGKYPVMYGRK